MELYLDELHRNDPELHPLDYDDDTVFNGIGPEPCPSSGGKSWPCSLGGQMGLLNTSVIPRSRAPLLISVITLKKMGAIVDFGRGRILLPRLFTCRWQK